MSYVNEEWKRVIKGVCKDEKYVHLGYRQGVHIHKKRTLNAKEMIQRFPNGYDTRKRFSETR